MGMADIIVVGMADVATVVFDLKKHNKKINKIKTKKNKKHQPCKCMAGVVVACLISELISYYFFLKISMQKKKKKKKNK